MVTFKEFLMLEATAVAKQYVQNGKLTQNEFDTIKDLDTTSSKKYVDWIAKQVVNKNIDLNKDADDLKKDLQIYDDLLNRKIIKSTIDMIKSFAEFKDVLKDSEGKESKSKTMNQDFFAEELKGFKKGQDYDIVHNDSKSIVYAIYNHKLSCAVGKDSGWCTTMPTSQSHWDNYSKQGTEFLYLIDKQTKSSGHGANKGTSKKVDYSSSHSQDMFAIHKEEDGTIKVTDKGDNLNKVTWSEIKSTYGLTDDIWGEYKNPGKRGIIYNPETVEEVVNNLFALGLIDNEDEVEIA
jgi:hypothetical protein